MQDPDLSIIIVSYNVKDFLLQCLKSVYAEPNFALKTEVIVVDNNSQDGSVSAVRSLFPQVLVLENKFNAGFPAANNQAFLKANGRYILMLNPDAEVMDNALVKMASYMDKNPNISMLAPKLLNTDKSIQNSVWRFPSVFSVFCESFHMNFLSRAKNYSDKSRDEIFEAESFSGAAILFRRSILDKIGMLDEKLFWIEDVDLCYRAKKTGLKLIYFPDAVILHHIGQSAKKSYNISISNQVVNKIKFFNKHHSQATLFLVILISYFSVLFKIIFFLFGSLFSHTNFKKFKAYIYTLPRISDPPVSFQ